MKIGSTDSVKYTPSFSGVVGKTEVFVNHGCGLNSTRAVVHLHPFKDEFISQGKKEEIEKKIENNYHSRGKIGCTGYDFGNRMKVSVDVEHPLSFTQEELEFAQQCPNSPKASKEALRFLSSDDCGKVTIKENGCGWLPTIV